MSNLSNECNASIWAKEWMRFIKEYPETPTDMEAMISWFANAIMAGYDRAKNEKPSETEREWIPVMPKLEDGDEYWLGWRDGAVYKSSYVRTDNKFMSYITPDYIMPYHPGTEKPEPPVERGA